MIRDVFYGKIRRDGVDNDQYLDYYVQVHGNTIEIGTPDMSFTGNLKKIDVLYYKSVNRYGEIASTVVCMSGVKDADDTSPLIYNPDYMLNNNEFEKSLEMLVTSIGPTLAWRNATITNTDINLLKSNIRDAVHPYEHFDEATTEAPKIADGQYRFDGWYELASVAPDYRDENNTPARTGFLRCTEDNGGAPLAPPSTDATIEYYTHRDSGGNHWRAMNDIVDRISIYSFVSFSNVHVPYVVIPFFTIKEANTIYQDILSKKLDKEWFTRLNVIKPKMVALYSAGEHDHFDVMQYIIQSMDLTLITI